MKRILGLDLGVTSIGWALVNEAENSEEKSSITKLGVRVNPLTVDEKQNFDTGKAITTNANRTLKRGARRNLQRYKLRRESLINILIANGLIDQQTILAERGNFTTFQTRQLRADAITQQISLAEFSRVLLMLNKKRGYKSSRKTDNKEDGQIIDGMAVAKELFTKNITPAQFVYERLCNNKYNIPDFYRSDLQNEFDRIWGFQKKYYPDILTDKLKEALKGKNKGQTWSICQQPFGIVGIKRSVKGKELIKENYHWRCIALSQEMPLEQLAIVLQEINGQMSGSSSYLGNIGDRSKELFFNKLTIGQHQILMLKANPHHSLKNDVYYRQDYIDEFNAIWNCQAKYYIVLTESLKKEIYNAIFFQRPLKSQKGLVSLCELESYEKEIEKNGIVCKKNIGPKVAPKASPLFQEFKIWQILNNLKVNKKEIELEDKLRLAKELSIKEKMSKSDILKLLYNNHKELDLNFREVEGNKTNAALYKAYAKIIELSGNGEYDFTKMSYDKALNIVVEIFAGLGYKTDFLFFNPNLPGSEFEQQPYFKLWHLIYSYQGDNSTTGNESLIKKIQEICGFEQEYAKILANVTFQDDYGSLSTKAMRKILPYMQEGCEYSHAVLCAYEGRKKHSKSSLTKEELDHKVYKEHLELLPKNSLRNPVVEKILNQMANVVNQVIDIYGKPDEVRIEMARELKKSAREREEMSKAISKATSNHEKIREYLKEKFNLSSPTRNDIVRYKLYEELKGNGYKTLYSNTYIPEADLFGKRFDIEHIIPQSRLFDDSFSNKTLELRDVNIEKSNSTAYDYVKAKYGEQNLSTYIARIEDLYKAGAISKTKFKHLQMAGSDIPEDFIARDLRDTQYIAKKAKTMLEEVVKSVVSTTGAITDRLREDWQLIDVMKELNWDKYNKLGLTYYRQDKDGRRIGEIKDWTKRNDHRHHAMDALAIAFTKRSYIQFLNNLNARIDKSIDDAPIDLSDYSLYSIPPQERSRVVRHIQENQLYRDKNNKLRFISPILPVEAFRQEAKKHLEELLISTKAKNKVATRNINTTKSSKGKQQKSQLTPRGQLHNETVYGSSLEYVTKLEKVGASFTREKISTVASPILQKALLDRLMEFEGNPKKAFTGKNSLEKNPIYINHPKYSIVPSSVKTVSLETRYTIRKSIDKDLKLDKIVDPKIRQILKKRLQEFDGKADKAFSNLDANPIWLNKEKGIAIKRVTIYGVNNAIALHNKHNHLGEDILNTDGELLPTDYVSTSNNHHIAIYKDPDGNLQENPVSFFEAITRVNNETPIIDKAYKQSEGWEFMFTMKRNEYFVFPDPTSGFDPNEIDLLNPDNYSLISPHLFRVQKLATKYYVFRHHLETNVEENPELRGIAWERITNLNKLNGIVKVRMNHLGQIVAIGEY